jgi:hypothetical protein
VWTLAFVRTWSNSANTLDGLDIFSGITIVVAAEQLRIMHAKLRGSLHNLINLIRSKAIRNPRLVSEPNAERVERSIHFRCISEHDVLLSLKEGPPLIIS